MSEFMGVSLLTYGDLKKFPENRAWELIDGKPFFMPRVDHHHETILSEIDSQLGELLKDKKCKVMRHPHVWLEAKSEAALDYLEPDLAVVCELGKVDGNEIVGVPDLIVEVVSPENRNLDWVTKLRRYRRAGVGEYWIVDPVGTVSTFQLRDGAYMIDGADVCADETQPLACYPDVKFDWSLVFPSQGHYAYPAVFSFAADGISIEFPDLPGCLTCGHSMKEALYNAYDAMALHLYGMAEEGMEIPPSTPLQEITPARDERIVLVEVSLYLFRKAMEHKKFWADMAAFDEAAAEAGGYVEPWSGPSLRVRDLIEYARQKGVEPAELTDEEYQTFLVTEEDEPDHGRE